MNTELSNKINKLPEDMIYVIINNNVYDITNFKHTGGNFIKNYNKQDVTTIFNNINHNKKHLEILEKYKVNIN